MRKAIKLNFHPFEFEKGNHAVEKADDSGRKRKYLMGIASGIEEDQDGERLTKNCIESIHKQAEGGQVLLTSDLHGKGATDDVGQLVSCEIKPNYDWYIENRLYDEMDNIGPHKLERCNDLWKQMKGLPPYKEPKQKGFSIEGYLTDLAGINTATGGRVINDMELDYITVVPRPSYNDSIAHAIQKSLDSKTTWQIKKNLAGRIAAKRNNQATYNEEKWNLETALDEALIEIMESHSEDKAREIQNTAEEYGNGLIDILMRYEDTFTSQDSTGVNKELMHRLARVAKSQPPEIRKKLEKIHTHMLSRN